MAETGWVLCSLGRLPNHAFCDWVPHLPLELAVAVLSHLVASEVHSLHPLRTGEDPGGLLGHPTVGTLVDVHRLEVEAFRQSLRLFGLPQVGVPRLLDRYGGTRLCRFHEDDLHGSQVSVAFLGHRVAPALRARFGAHRGRRSMHI